MELFKTVPAYSWLFIIFANTEIYVIQYKTLTKIYKWLENELFKFPYPAFNFSKLLCLKTFIKSILKLIKMIADILKGILL